LAEALRRIAPYLLTELLLPGGTLLALVLFVSRYRRKRRAQMAAAAANDAPVPHPETAAVARAA
ncbi:MAG TPA: hypothetical protein VFY80_02530, partial [Burkholderiales bacterium]|nr:hypothetical protein [Burkholderiales bacterium]